MKRALIATLFATLPAFAFADDFAAVDADADGLVSLTEAQAVWADLSEEAFAALDTDADGSLNAEEFAAGVEAGTLTVTAE